MPAPVYDATLTGFGVNLLVADIPAAIAFAKTILEAGTIYADPGFAVLRRGSGESTLHADHTYENHSFSGYVYGR
tara:strand:- start:533 stop:757 length:225 start_codon:yes stop_codon:yes gene_type:complete